MTIGEDAKKTNIIRWMAVISALALAAFFIGFAVFANAVGSIRQPTALRQADAIIVLTGGQKRLEPALELLDAGKGKKLLISGVHPSTQMSDIRRLTSIKDSLFDCCVILDREALDTVGNAKQGAEWAKANGYERIILVTNNYHMPRSLIEMQRAAPSLDIQPYAVVNTDISQGKWAAHPEAFRVIALEYAKYVATRLHLVSKSGLTSETAFAKSQ